MNAVKYLIGSADICRKPLPPYCRDACEFSATLSAALLRDPAAKKLPDVTSLAFWCRKGNLTKLKAEFSSGEFRLGRGLAFHIAPANVPVNFAFSFLFSLLAGNANIVRVPSRPYPQVEIICSALAQVLEGYPEIKKRTAFVSYPADNEITAQFSAMADARIIWGGDETVASVRVLPCKPRCIDLVFADRYSLCILDGDTILAASEQELLRLAEGFYNDTYLMDQNACSSPQIVLWLNGTSAAKERFWTAVAENAAPRYDLQAAVAVDKYTQACGDAIRLNTLSGIKCSCNILYRAGLAALPEDDLTGLRGRGGYFYECDLSSLNVLAPHVTEKYQTITYFGVQPADLQAFVIENRLTGIDRIVPVGAAMNIGVIWDGYDVVGTLSRIVQMV